MTLKERITEDMKSAMRAGEKERLGTIRLALAAIKQREVDERIMLDDGQVLAVLEKMIKQRRESIELYNKGNRPELAEKERGEIAIIERFLPKAMSDEEAETAIKGVIAATGASSIKDMGKVMAVVKSQAQGRADMGAVSARVKEKLAAR